MPKKPRIMLASTPEMPFFAGKMDDFRRKWPFFGQKWTIHSPKLAGHGPRYTQASPRSAKNAIPKPNWVLRTLDIWQRTPSGAQCQDQVQSKTMSMIILRPHGQKCIYSRTIRRRLATASRPPRSGHGGRRVSWSSSGAPQLFF